MKVIHKQSQNYKLYVTDIPIQEISLIFTLFGIRQFWVTVKALGKIELKNKILANNKNTVRLVSMWC